MKRPDGEVVRFVIRKVLAGKPVHSQAELARLVTIELRKADREHAVTGARIRHLLVGLPVEMRIRTKRGKLPPHCPSCGGRLKKVLSKTLVGKSIPVGARCSRCRYRGTQGRYAPGRYEFWLRT